MLTPSTYSGTVNVPAAAVKQVIADMEAGRPIKIRTPDGAETQCLIVAVESSADGAVATLVGCGDQEAFASWTDDDQH